MLSRFPIQLWALYVYTTLTLSLPLRGDIQSFYDVASLTLTVAAFGLAWGAFRGHGVKRTLRTTLQILSASYLPLGVEIFLFDHPEWNLHVAKLQAEYNIFPWFTNATLFFCSLGLLLLTSATMLPARLPNVNPLRERRLWEVRRRLHTRNLDIGAGSHPITRESVTLDVQACKHPMVRANVLDGLPFPDGSFDSVTALEVLEHFGRPDQAFVLGEIHRVLQSGGQLVVTLPYSWGPMRLAQKIAWFVRSRTTIREYYANNECHGHIGLVEPGDLQRMMMKVGFRIKESRRLMLYDYLVVAAR